MTLSSSAVPASCERALCWVRDTLAALNLKLHPDKTKIVNDREEGYDLSGLFTTGVFFLGRRQGS